MLDTIIISTLTGSIVCLMLLFFKDRLLRLLGGKALYRISLFAMLIFVIPLNISNIQLPKPGVKPIHNEAAIVRENTAPTQANGNAQTAMPNEVQNNLSEPVDIPEVPSVSRRENPITVQEILIAVWLVGFLISISRYFISYYRFKKKICSFEQCDKINGVQVIKSPIISSPMIFGFFKPTLAIPEFEMETEDYELAIKHEMIHFKHHDSWLKLFAVIINSVCWFNPITYFMVNLIGETCEYACDEQVTKEMDIGNKQKYSEMILSMVCQASPALSSNMAKNKKQLKRRFEMIMKKKNTNVIQTVVCSILMLTMLCSSVVFANEITPLVSSLFKNDYVYIVSFGEGSHINNVPVQKDGEYFLPLRQFFNNCKIENDKIKYDDGKITVDMWSHGMVVHNGNDSSFTMPGGHIWSTACEIGNKKVTIGDEEYTLSNAPYIDDDTTYIPYEYIKLLKMYEDTSLKPITFEEGSLYTHTSAFSSVRLIGYDSMENKYYTDNVQFCNILKDNKMLSELTHRNWTTLGSDTAEIKKTGYRTELYIKTEVTNTSKPEEKAEIEIVLNKVTRVYSKGSDIEGLFTVKVNGRTVYDNEIGYITDLPIKAGEGLCDHGETNIYVGDIRLNTWFRGFDIGNEGEKSSVNRSIDKLEDTKTLLLRPEEVKFNGRNVIRTSNYNVFIYNINKGYANINAEFNDNNGEDYSDATYYRIDSGEECDAHFIDENTFSTYIQLMKDNVRIDSFEAIVSLLPDNKFELISNDGKYIVRGTTSEFVPMWEWSEEQKKAPLPFVKMINE